ncbi:hypothetical protein pb186bvf_014237 [Paramecium bursaria]
MKELDQKNKFFYFKNQKNIFCFYKGKKNLLVIV